MVSLSKVMNNCIVCLLIQLFVKKLQHDNIIVSARETMTDDNSKKLRRVPDTLVYLNPALFVLGMIGYFIIGTGVGTSVIWAPLLFLALCSPLFVVVGFLQLLFGSWMILKKKRKKLLYKRHWYSAAVVGLTLIVFLVGIANGLVIMV